MRVSKPEIALSFKFHCLADHTVTRSAMRYSKLQARKMAVRHIKKKPSPNRLANHYIRGMTDLFWHTDISASMVDAIIEYNAVIHVAA